VKLSLQPEILPTIGPEQTTPTAAPTGAAPEVSPEQPPQQLIPEGGLPETNTDQQRSVDLERYSKEVLTLNDDIATNNQQNSILRDLSTLTEEIIGFARQAIDPQLTPEKRGLISQSAQQLGAQFREIAGTFRLNAPEVAIPQSLPPISLVTPEQAQQAIPPLEESLSVISRQQQQAETDLASLSERVGNLQSRSTGSRSTGVSIDSAQTAFQVAEYSQLDILKNPDTALFAQANNIGSTVLALLNE
jgi:hypothetical protein